MRIFRSLPRELKLERKDRNWFRLDKGFDDLHQIASTILVVIAKIGRPAGGGPF